MTSSRKKDDRPAKTEQQQDGDLHCSPPPPPLLLLLAARGKQSYEHCPCFSIISVGRWDNARHRFGLPPHSPARSAQLNLVQAASFFARRPPSTTIPCRVPADDCQWAKVADEPVQHINLVLGGNDSTERFARIYLVLPPSPANSWHESK